MESIIDGFIALINLTMDFALIVIPDFPTGSWHRGSNRQKGFHLAGLKYAARTRHQCNCFTSNDKTFRKNGGRQMVVKLIQSTQMRKGFRPNGKIRIVMP